MNDELDFGDPAKRPARLGESKPQRAGTSLAPGSGSSWPASSSRGRSCSRSSRGADEAGKQIAGSRSEAISQIDRAYDAAAQGTIGRAAMVAVSVYAESGSFAADLASLSAYDPELGSTSGPSNDPMTISYATDASGFGAAVRSESGTCWWAKIDTDSVTTYGSGSPCTGIAAMAASAPSWTGPRTVLSITAGTADTAVDGRLLRVPDRRAVA